MLEIALTLVIFVILLIPVGNYLYSVSAQKKSFVDKLFNPIDKVIYKVCCVNPEENMHWKQYATVLIGVNLFMIVLCYIILTTQGYLGFNPNGISNMEPSLAFNTAVSFMTNTNLQHYSGESGLSYFSQMLVICSMMFISAASGYAACIAFVRGLAYSRTDGCVGNFFVDMTRITTRVLLPLSMIAGLLLIWQGVPQNLDANLVVTTLEGSKQIIAMGPIAAIESIKHIGTNGGGFIGANSATPLENPTIISDLIELYSMMILPGACVIMFGKTVRNRLKFIEGGAQNTSKEDVGTKLFGREGRSIFLCMAILFIIGLLVCWWAEWQGNPVLSHLGISQSMGSLEGKEWRFGITQSAIFTTTTTSFTTGTVNNMHDTLTPLGGLVPMLHMMINAVFGGLGVGLMNIIVYAILAVFICGLMIGRTPEYLSKKIESREMKLAALCIIIHPLLILGFTALAVSTHAGIEAVTNPGFHGLSQMVYEFSSAAANNGSGFEGLGDNTTFWNITTGIVMYIGRYASIALQLAIAGSLLQKRFVVESSSTLHTDNVGFAIILVFVVYIFAALTFFPILALGPIAEHLSLWM